MSPSPESQPAVEMPLGNQRPLGAATPLGQAVPRLQFMRPLGAKPLGILKPEIFNSGLDGLHEQWPNPLENAKSFSDSSFFTEAPPAPTSSVSPQSNLQAARSRQSLSSPTLPVLESLGEADCVEQQEVASTSSLGAADFSPQADALPLQQFPDADTSIAPRNEPAQLDSAQSDSILQASQRPAESVPELNAPLDYNQATTVDWPGGFETSPPVASKVTASREPERSHPAPSLESTSFSQTPPTPAENSLPPALSIHPADTSSSLPISEPPVLQAQADSVGTSLDSELSRGSNFVIAPAPSSSVQLQPNEPLPEPTEPEPLQPVVQRAGTSDRQNSNSESLGHGDSSPDSSTTAQKDSFSCKDASATNNSSPSLQAKSVQPLDISTEPYPTTIDWPGHVGQPAESPNVSSSTTSSATVSSSVASTPAVLDYGNDSFPLLPATNGAQPSSIQAKSSALGPAETLTQDTNVVSPSVEPLTSPPPRIKPELPANNLLEPRAVDDTFFPGTSPTSLTYHPDLQAPAETAVSESEPAIETEAGMEPSEATQAFSAAERSIQRAKAIPPETEQLDSAASLSENSRGDSIVPESTGTEFAMPGPASPEPAGLASVEPTLETPSTTIPESADFQHSTDNLGTAKPAIMTSPNAAMGVSEPLQSATAQAAIAPSEAESSLEQSAPQISLSPDPVAPVAHESEAFQQNDQIGNISAATPESSDRSAPTINRASEPVPTSPAVPSRLDSLQQSSNTENISRGSSSPSIINWAVEPTPTAPASSSAEILPSQAKHQPPSLPLPTSIAEASSEAKIQRSLPTEKTTTDLAQELQHQDQDQSISPSSIQAQSEASQPPPFTDELKQNQPSPKVQLQEQDQYFYSGEEPAIASVNFNSDPSPSSVPTQPARPTPSSAQPADSANSIAKPTSPQSPTIQRLTTEHDASEKQLSPHLEPTLLQANFSDETEVPSAEASPELASASETAESTTASLPTSPAPPSSAESSPPEAAPAQPTANPPPARLSYPPTIQANLDAQQREEHLPAIQPAASSLPIPPSPQASVNDAGPISQQPETADAPSPGKASASPPAPSSWSGIADLLAQSAGLSPHTATASTSAPAASALPSSPPNLQASPAQPTAPEAYADLQPYASPSSVLQRSPAIQADAEIEAPEPETIAETPASETNSDAATNTEAALATSAAKLEELAQVIYRMMQQRMAVERERFGSNYSSRFSR